MRVSIGQTLGNERIVTSLCAHPGTRSSYFVATAACPDSSREFQSTPSTVAAYAASPLHQSEVCHPLRRHGLTIGEYDLQSGACLSVINAPDVIEQKSERISRYEFICRKSFLEASHSLCHNFHAQSTGRKHMILAGEESLEQLLPIITADGTNYLAAVSTSGWLFAWRLPQMDMHSVNDESAGAAELLGYRKIATNGERIVAEGSFAHAHPILFFSYGDSGDVYAVLLEDNTQNDEATSSFDNNLGTQSESSLGPINKRKHFSELPVQTVSVAHSSSAKEDDKDDVGQVCHFPVICMVCHTTETTLLVSREDGKIQAFNYSSLFRAPHRQAVDAASNKSDHDHSTETSVDVQDLFTVTLSTADVASGSNDLILSHFALPFPSSKESLREDAAMLYNLAVNAGSSIRPRDYVRICHSTKLHRLTGSEELFQQKKSGNFVQCVVLRFHPRLQELFLTLCLDEKQSLYFMKCYILTPAGQPKQIAGRYFRTEKSLPFCAIDAWFHPTLPLIRLAYVFSELPVSEPVMVSHFGIESPDMPHFGPAEELTGNGSKHYNQSQSLTSRKSGTRSCHYSFLLAASHPRIRGLAIAMRPLPLHFSASEKTLEDRSLTLIRYVFKGDVQDCTILDSQLLGIASECYNSTSMLVGLHPDKNSRTISGCNVYLLKQFSHFSLEDSCWKRSFHIYDYDIHQKNKSKKYRWRAELPVGKNERLPSENHLSSSHANSMTTFSPLRLSVSSHGDFVCILGILNSERRAFILRNCSLSTDKDPSRLTNTFIGKEGIYGATDCLIYEQSEHNSVPSHEDEVMKRPSTKNSALCIALVLEAHNDNTSTIKLLTEEAKVSSSEWCHISSQKLLCRVRRIFQTPFKCFHSSTESTVVQWYTPVVLYAYVKDGLEWLSFSKNIESVDKSKAASLVPLSVSEQLEISKSAAFYLKHGEFVKSCVWQQNPEIDNHYKTDVHTAYLKKAMALFCMPSIHKSSNSDDQLCVAEAMCGVITNLRVLILSGRNLKVLAETRTDRIQITGKNLVWIGSSVIFRCCAIIDASKIRVSGDQFVYMTPSGKIGLLSSDAMDQDVLCVSSPDRLICVSDAELRSSPNGYAMSNSLTMRPFCPLQILVCGLSDLFKDRNFGFETKWMLQFLLQRIVKLYSHHIYQRPTGCLIDALMEDHIRLPLHAALCTRSVEVHNNLSANSTEFSSELNFRMDNDTEKNLSSAIAVALFEEKSIAMFRDVQDLGSRLESIFACSAFNTALAQLLVDSTHIRSEDDLRQYAADPVGCFLSRSSLPLACSDLSQKLIALSGKLFEYGQFSWSARCADLAGDDRLVFLSIAASYTSLCAAESGRQEIEKKTGSRFHQLNGGRTAIEHVLDQLQRETTNSNVGRASLLLLARIHDVDVKLNEEYSQAYSSLHLRPHAQELAKYDRRTSLLSGLDNLPFFPKLEDCSSLLHDFVCKSSQSTSNIILKRGSKLPPLYIDNAALWLGLDNYESQLKEDVSSVQENEDYTNEYASDDSSKEGEDIVLKRIIDFNKDAFCKDDPKLEEYIEDLRSGLAKDVMVLNGSDKHSHNTIEYLRNHLKKSVLATSITGGADPERAVVAYFRFEADHFHEEEKHAHLEDETISHPVLLDVGPYGNHATLLGGNTLTGSLVCLGNNECESPMEQIRRQTQLPLLIKGIENGTQLEKGETAVLTKKERKKLKKRKKKKHESDAAMNVNSVAISLFNSSARSASMPPRCAKDVCWGLIVPVNWETGQNVDDAWDQGTLQLGFNQGKHHRNHCVCTIEMWMKCDVEHVDKEVVILARGAGSQSVAHSAESTAKLHSAGTSGEMENSGQIIPSPAASIPWQWSLCLMPKMKSCVGQHLMFRTSGKTENEIEQQIQSHANSLDHEDTSSTAQTAPAVVPHRWYHVCLVIDANRSSGNRARSENTTGFVSIYLNGKLATSGNVAEPTVLSDAADHSLGLFVFPNAIGWRLTELRVWAASRPQHEVDAGKEWTLKLAKKSRSGKKRGAALFKGVTIKAATKSSTLSKDNPSGLKIGAPSISMPSQPDSKLSIGGPGSNHTGRRRRRKKK